MEAEEPVVMREQVVVVVVVVGSAHSACMARRSHLQPRYMYEDDEHA